MEPSLVATGDTPATPEGVPALPLARDGHRLWLRRRRGRVRAVPRPLPPDEERAGEDDGETGDPRVQADAGDLVRGVDAEELDPEPPDAVEEDVQREQPARPDPEEPLDGEQH